MRCKTTGKHRILQDKLLVSELVLEALKPQSQTLQSALWFGAGSLKQHVTLFSSSDFILSFWGENFNKPLRVGLLYLLSYFLLFCLLPMCEYNQTKNLKLCQECDFMFQERRKITHFILYSSFNQLDPGSVFAFCLKSGILLLLYRCRLCSSTSFFFEIVNDKPLGFPLVLYSVAVRWQLKLHCKIKCVFHDDFRGSWAETFLGKRWDVWDFSDVWLFIKIKDYIRDWKLQSKQVSALKKLKSFSQTGPDLQALSLPCWGLRVETRTLRSFYSRNLRVMWTLMQFILEEEKNLYVSASVFLFETPYLDQARPRNERRGTHVLEPCLCLRNCLWWDRPSCVEEIKKTHKDTWLPSSFSTYFSTLGHDLFYSVNGEDVFMICPSTSIRFVDVFTESNVPL